MPTQQELSDKLDTIGVTLNNIASDTQALKKQIEDLTVGQPVTQEQLDALHGKADSILGLATGIDQSVP